MSSSDDHSQDDFIPFNIGECKRFDDEVVQNQDGLDLDQFKVLFSPSDIEDQAPEPFTSLHGDGEKQQDAEPFTLLFTKGGKEEPISKSSNQSGEEAQASGQTLEDEQESLPEEEQEPEPQESLEEQAIEQGYQEGFEKGHTEGFDQGHREGLEKGEQEGLVKGEEEGFQKGLEKGEQEGFDAGKEQGAEAAQAEARQEIQDSLDTLKQALDEVNSLAEHIVDRYEQQLIRLVLKIAEKVVSVSLDADDQLIRRTVLDALKTLVNPEEIVLSISPDDYAYIEMIKDEFFEEVSSLESISVQSDALINRGGCKIETRTGTVSVDPEAKMKAIQEALMAFHNNGHGPI